MHTPTRMQAVQQYNANRRFPEITGEDNLSVFLLWDSEDPAWRRRRRAILRQF